MSDIVDDIMEAARKVVVEDLGMDIPGSLQSSYIQCIAEAIEAERERSRTLLSKAEQKLQDAKKIAVNAESYGYGHGLEAAASYHDHMAANHAANHKHVVSDYHEMLEKTHVKCASDIRALQSEER